MTGRPGSRVKHSVIRGTSEARRIAPPEAFCSCRRRPVRRSPEPGREQPARDGLYLIRSVRDSLEKVKLANFTARIVADLHHDDGVESARFFQIQNQLKGRTASFILPAAGSPRSWPGFFNGWQQEC